MEIYGTLRPPPKNALGAATSATQDLSHIEPALANGSLRLVSPLLHAHHEDQVDTLREIDSERHYWWAMVYAFPAPHPLTLFRRSKTCKQKGKPVAELYPPYLSSLQDNLARPTLDLRIFLWLENVFDGLKVFSEEDLRPSHLTPSTLLLLAKDNHHPNPRFVIDLSDPSYPSKSKDFLLPPELTKMKENVYLEHFNGLTPTSISPRKHFVNDKDVDSAEAYATFLLGMVFMAILRTSSLRYERRDFYNDLSILANDMTAFNPLRRPSLEKAKERYLALVSNHKLLEDVSLETPLLSTLKTKKPKKRLNEKSKRQKKK